MLRLTWKNTCVEVNFINYNFNCGFLTSDFLWIFALLNCFVHFPCSEHKQFLQNKAVLFSKFGLRFAEAPAVQLSEHAQAILEDDERMNISRDDPTLQRLARGSAHAASWFGFTYTMLNFNCNSPSEFSILIFWNGFHVCGCGFTFHWRQELALQPWTMRGYERQSLLAMER